MHQTGTEQLNNTEPMPTNSVVLLPCFPTVLLPRFFAMQSYVDTKPRERKAMRAQSDEGTNKVMDTQSLVGTKPHERNAMWTHSDLQMVKYHDVYFRAVNWPAICGGI